MEIIVETHQLIIGKMIPGDTDLLYQLTSDQRVMHFFPKVLSYDETAQLLKKIIRHYSKHGYCFWKLRLKENHEFVGIAGLLHQEIAGNVETEIAYRIKPQYWCRGYATEAAQACKQYGQCILNKKRLISLIHPENIASKRVAQKLGAKKTKTISYMGLAHEMHIY